MRGCPLVHQRRVDWVIWHLTQVVEQYYAQTLTLLAQGKTPRGVYVELLHLRPGD
jgi:phage terminase Nu1 subunit (DNA packaging protein)